MSAAIVGIPGTDPTLPSVPFEFRGITYSLALSFRTLATFQKVTSINPLGAMEFNPSTVSALIWAALMKQLPDLTMDEVQDSLSFADAKRAIDALTALLEVQKPKPDEGQEGELPNPPSA